MLIKILALIAGFAGMELMAHVAHKYVMHGFLWSLHKSHHQKGNSFFEKNDFYFLIFATPGILLLLYGMYESYSWKFFLGLGITLYGFTYLILHDIVIHQRLRWFTKLDNPYINAMRRAHKAHHANVHKNAAVNYGLLWVDRKYFKPNHKQ
ncbi:MAG TPA: sterol desaturase family protein [Chitinophagales bacterium]|nr:sterol desaturase family protein [Chitinophagales bacterium]